MSLSRFYTKRNLLVGVLTYPIGDSIGAIILNEFSIYRLLGVALLTLVFYSVEIPLFFGWIDRYTKRFKTKFSIISVRALLAVVYFNPLWIARQDVVIHLCLGDPLSWNILSKATDTYFTSLLVAILGNILIQGFIHLKYRFLSSGIFSIVMNMIYAILR